MIKDGKFPAFEQEVEAKAHTSRNPVEVDAPGATRYFPEGSRAIVTSTLLEGREGIVNELVLGQLLIERFAIVH